MTDNLKKAISCICENNMYGAKLYVRKMLLENPKELSKADCQSMLQKMDDADFGLPNGIKNMLFVENPQKDINVRRYYLSDREKEVVDTVIRMEKVSDKLSELNVNYVNSIMLYGESGTGKTTLAKYIARQLNLPFFYMNFTQIIDSLMGQTSKNITNIFQFVNQQRAVLLLDEIDAIGVKRNNSKEVGELSRIVIGLMQNLDQLKGNIVLIGATNRVDILDKALLRRFAQTHEVKRLSEHERRQMVSLFFSDINVPIPEDDAALLASMDETQAALMNRMVMWLADHFEAEIANENA